MFYSSLSLSLQFFFISSPFPFDLCLPTSSHYPLQMRNANCFVEWGCYEKNYFGTAFTAVREVIKSGKVCVLALQPEVSALFSSIFHIYDQSYRLAQGSKPAPLLTIIWLLVVSLPLILAPLQEVSCTPAESTGWENGKRQSGVRLGRSHLLYGLMTLLHFAKWTNLCWLRKALLWKQALDGWIESTKLVVGFRKT